MRDADGKKPVVIGNSRTVFGIPFILAAVSLAGLLAALLGDESWRYIAWPAVASPLLVTGWYVARARSFFSKDRHS